RNHAPDCSENDRIEFARWLAADPKHEQEYKHMETLWLAIEPLDSFYAPQVSPKPPPATGLSQQARFFALSTAAVVALAVGIIWHYNLQNQQGQQYTTAIGQQDKVTLADGSILELNTDTSVTVTYTRDFRELHLERGEVFVQVAHETKRPFVVKAGAGETKDVGTQFSIYLKPGSTSVTVLEGEVQVNSGPDASHRTVTELRGGERVAYNTQGRQTPRERIDVKALQAWRHGELIVRNQSLAQVIDELERYHHVKISVSTPQLGAQRVSGVFKAQDLNGIVAAIATLLNIEARWPSADQVLLTDAGRK
ncbi:MAG: FecR family protein, partial [Pyrinomonadaceae bacterium]